MCCYQLFDYVTALQSPKCFHVGTYSGHHSNSYSSSHFTNEETGSTSVMTYEGFLALNLIVCPPPHKAVGVLLICFVSQSFMHLLILAL